MTEEILTPEVKKMLLNAQKNEITEFHIYKKLAKSIKNPNNKRILEQIADEELKHYNIGKELSKEEIKPNKWKIWFYYVVSKIFGLTFAIKRMENGEKSAQQEYQKLTKVYPHTKEIIDDEVDHEKELINLIDEERLKYVGSMVLGINDALVELTGALAGLTFAFQNTQLIATTGFITGIAATLSMSASEYLSTKSEQNEKRPVKAAIYTGFAYLITVLLLIFPYLIYSNYYLCLAIMLVNAILIILIFNYYISVAKDLNFKKRFLEMTFISLGIAGLSFVLGVVIKIFFNI